MPNIPELAETAFQSECHQYGATINKAHQDRHGWDYLVEIPAIPNPNLPADMQAGSLKCFVQVKSTTVLKKDFVKYKLSNLSEFARSHYPCFDLLLTYSTSGKLLKVRLRHFWRDEIELTMRKLRELELRPEPTELNTIEVLMSFKKAAFLSMDQVVPQIHQTILSLGPGYGAEKQQFCNNIGFSDGVVQGNFRIKGYDPLKFALHQIGIGDDIEVELLNIHNVRFGISSRNPVETHANAAIRLTPGGYEAKLSMQNLSGGFVFDLAATATVPFAPGLEIDKIPVKVDAGIVDVFLDPSTKTLTYNSKWSLDAIHGVETLRSILNSLLMFTQEKIIIRIYIRQFLVASSTQVGKKLKFDPRNGPVWHFLDRLWRNRNSGDLSNFRASYFELLNRSKTLVSFLVAIDSDGGSVEFDYDSDGEPIIGAGYGFYAVRIRFEDCVVSALVQRSIKMFIEDDGRVHVKMSDVINASYMIFPSDFDEMDSVLKAAV